MNNRFQHGADASAVSDIIHPGADFLFVIQPGFNFLFCLLGKSEPDLCHLLQNRPVLAVISLFGKQETFVGEFSIILWRFHAKETTQMEPPFRVHWWHAAGTICLAFVPPIFQPEVAKF